MWLLGQSLSERLHKVVRKEKPAALATVGRRLTASVIAADLDPDRAADARPGRGRGTVMIPPPLRAHPQWHRGDPRREVLYWSLCNTKETSFTVELPAGQGKLWQRF
jgi:hypothetical protein